MFEIFLGHLVGDYLLQNEEMAINKSKYNLIGWIYCLIHCILYTIAVCTIMWNFNPYWVTAVFLSHFLIDKFGIAEWYLANIKGRSLKKYVDPYGNLDEIIYIPKPKVEINRYDALQGGFTAVVYTLTDNTMHLLLMWFAYQIIF